jgi:glycosyltransferase involved in cell wall biosynthesis
MKILTLNYEFPPLGGGGAPVSYNLAKELVNQGHEIDVVTMGFSGLKRFESVEGINVYRVPCLRRKKEICHTPEMISYVLLALPTAVKLAREKRYDLNHTHFIFPTGVLSLMLKRLTGLAYVLTVHGSDVPGYNPDRFKVQHKVLAPLWKQVLRDAGRIIPLTEYLRSLILVNGPYESKITVIPNGFYPNTFLPRTKEKKILLVSRLLRRKGFQYFLEAIKNLDLDYEINIVGDGPYLRDLKQMAGDNTTRVNFLGWLDNNSPAMKQLYETSSIFVFPSEAENFPIVLLEAMSARMAIITSNSTGCPEVVGDTALLVNPRDAVGIRECLLRLIHDDALRETMAQKAFERVQSRFLWQKVAAAYVGVYEELVRKG